MRDIETRHDGAATAMIVDDDSMYIEERHALPDDWQNRLLGLTPTGSMAPIVAAVQAIVRRHGETAIVVWHVQELALWACGIDRSRFHAAYDVVCARLTTLGGSEWPLTISLDEHIGGNHHPIQLSHRFLSCDGEWRALLRLADAGWQLVRHDRGGGDPDWVVQKNDSKLCVEVKTKLPLASATGRLTRAFIGLGLLPRFSFLRELDYSWYADDHLDDATTLAFFESFLKHVDEIAAHSDAGLSPAISLACDKGKLRLFVRAPRDFSLELFRNEKDSRVTRQVVLDAKPASVASHLFTGGASARSSNGPDVELPMTSSSFRRLLRPNQMRRIDRDTLVMLIWHMPFPALSYEAGKLGAFWQAWCDEQGILRGALQRITPVGNFLPMLLTDCAAREIDLDHLCI